MAAESRPVSPFVLQKIRERREAALTPEAKEPEEVEEAEEAEEDEDEEEAEPAREVRPLEARRSHHAIGERSRARQREASGGVSLTDRASKFFKNLGPTETWLLIGGGLLMANHLMVPRGTSVLSKMLSAIAPAPKPRPVLRAPAYYAGANNQAGWNRGMSPYGPWGHAAPGGPSPYAHGDSWGW
jgi:hypothetical protein